MNTEAAHWFLSGEIWLFITTLFYFLAITFILALSFCWSIDSLRPWLIRPSVIHFAIRIWKLANFDAHYYGVSKNTKSI